MKKVNSFDDLKKIGIFSIKSTADVTYYSYITYLEIIEPDLH